MTAGDRHRLTYLDGLRGLAAMVVVMHHLVMAFCPWYADGEVRYLGPSAKLPLAPLAALWSGNFAVCVFFVLSGYVLASMTLRTQASMAALVVRRLVRLALPVLAALLFACALWRLGLMRNQEAAVLGHSQGWFGLFYGDRPRLGRVFRDVLVMPLKDAKDVFVPMTWTMHWEYMGSFAIFLVHGLLRQRARTRLAVLLALVPVLWNHYYVDFLGGALLGDLRAAGRSNHLPIAARTAAIVACLVLASWLGLYPWSSGEGTPWHWLDAVPDLWTARKSERAHMIAAIFLLAALVMSNTAQALVARRVPLALGRLSFAVYLLHFPLLCSAGAATFIAVQPKHGLWAAFAAATMATMAATLALAHVFTKAVDAPANLLSHQVSRWVDKQLPRLRNPHNTGLVGKIWRHVPHGRAS